MSDNLPPVPPPLPAPQDLSDNAVRFARLVERLEPGNKYMIFLTRSERKGDAWAVEVFVSSKIADRVIREREQSE